MTKKRIQYHIDWANYCKSNGGYNINPMPGASAILEMAEHIEKLEKRIEKLKGK